MKDDRVAGAVPGLRVPHERIGKPVSVDVTRVRDSSSPEEHDPRRLRVLNRNTHRKVAGAGDEHRVMPVSDGVEADLSESVSVDISEGSDPLDGKTRFGDIQNDTIDVCPDTGEIEATRQIRAAEDDEHLRDVARENGARLRHVDLAEPVSVDVRPERSELTDDGLGVGGSTVDDDAPLDLLADVGSADDSG